MSGSRRAGSLQRPECSVSGSFFVSVSVRAYLTASGREQMRQTISHLAAITRLGLSGPTPTIRPHHSGASSSETAVGVASRRRRAATAARRIAGSPSSRQSRAALWATLDPAPHSRRIHKANTL